MSFQNLLFELRDSIALVTLNRPERRNALSVDLMTEVVSCLDNIGRDPQIRAVILGAAGNVFCAGHDLGELQGRTLEEYRAIFDLCTVMMTKIQAIPQPVIAEVQGVATAAGCQLVATCDLALASEKAAFATPGVRIGLFCSTPMVALSRAVGRKRAMEMLLTGDLIDAQTAAGWGLVNRVVPAEELSSETWKLACRIASASGLVVGIGKRAFYAQVDLDQAQAYGYVGEVMTVNALAQDAQEGIAAFLEKRPACWTGQ